MSLLPTTSRVLHNLARFPSQMPDFELATWQLFNLCVAPRKVYRQVYYHKQTKNTWARDDPAVLMILTSTLCLAGILWGFDYSLGPLGTLRTVLVMVLRDCLLLGIVSATALWFISNSLLQAPASIHTTDQRVEWAYALDVHTNGFFPAMLELYFVQLLFKPVLVRHNWICLLLGNGLYLVAFGQYWYVTYLGYNALPFLQRTELLLFPVLVLVAFFMVSLLGFNCPRHFLSLYFGSI
ncbi:related to Protein GMH1 homolog [Pseudozyma flocculosa]|uniref:Related to Protein GMH1 homolog n=1 Tax=Pseudozyma flocculosa TaxID=84751 RepID=A0A5C3F1D9_9BASI|nr:related to Protein GMH1 homolog [Pseudozyma flocculosa]